MADNLDDGDNAGNANNPFDFDVDFEKVKNRRRVREQQLKEREQATATANAAAAQNLLSGMDVDGDGRSVAALANRDPTRAASTIGTTSAKNRMLQMFRRNRQAEDVDEEEKKEILYGGKRVVQWPFDDFHMVQQEYYTKVAEIADGLDGPRSDEEKRADADGNKRMAAGASSMPLFQRPADPPDIPTAVMGLSLVDFENKAEERSISIVSTWLFDAGLIDELLVHGGMGQETTAVAAASDLIKSNSPANQSADSIDPSVKSSEGVEIGIISGLPIEGASKMDKEIAKLRGETQRQLALINARLNDGVAASGAEVQELVNAVTTVKDDLGKLRELSTYISNVGDVGDEDGQKRSSKFLLTRYPKLKKAINARRNLARCFRELDFYSQIPVTCDRLREELHAGEWTAQEWTTLRNVSREHVELEIFLVEAEAGMKKRIDDELAENNNGGAGGDSGKDGNSSQQLRSRRSSMGGASTRFRSTFSSGAGLPHNYEEVDNFLHEHVKNVWELGDEIRLRIMSGIGTAFELAMNNPAGMVALVEAVEVYETANEEYKTVHGEEAGENQTLRFTDMRASALKQIFQDFEMRSLEVFREATSRIERTAEDDLQADNAEFSAVLRAANGLTSEIGFVQNQMAPCFPPYWALETLWSTCVAHVCSKQILEQIGGPEGHKLQDLTVTQLLDLVAWVENFRETIEESFPNIGKHSAKKTYFNERPELLMDNNKQVDMDVAKDSLAWANNMLWEVHDLAKDEFLYRTKEQTDEWLDRVYGTEHTKNQTSEGLLTTSLCEDVFSLAGVQLRTIRERLTRRSEALVQAVGVIFKNLYDKQMACREQFLLDFETCCASANDFIRMSDQCEEILSDLQAECNLSATATEALEEQSAILLGLYSTDAVYAAQKCHIYIFEPIEEAITEELFGDEWLNNLTHNELAMTLVKTLEDFMGDLGDFLDDLMLGKTVDAMLIATINFYIKSLVKKATAHKDNRNSAFSDNQLALNRIMGDIKTMKEYFAGIAPEFPSLNRGIDNEFEVLETVYELVAIAAGVSQSSTRDFILFLQKRVRNIPITKFVVGDLWHLVNPKEEKGIYELIDSMEDELKAIAPTDEQAISAAGDRMAVPGLRLDQELARLCTESKRNRPGLKKTAMEQADVMLNRWRETWSDLVDGENKE